MWFLKYDSIQTKLFFNLKRDFDYGNNIGHNKGEV